MARARDFLKQLFSSLREHQVVDLAAQLAYWALLALFPFVMFLLTVIGYLPLQGIDRQLLSIVYRIMPHPAAQLIDQTIHEIIGRQRGWLLAVTLVGALWSASGGMSGIITALNRAYGVAETRPWWRVKLMSIGLTVAAVVLFIVAAAGLIIGPNVLHHVAAWVRLSSAFDTTWRWARWPTVVASLIMMLAFMYHFLPNVKHRFHLMSVGSIVAVLLWLMVSAAFNLYVSFFHAYARTYGTLATAIVLMIWLYLSALVLILGGEINALIVKHHVTRQSLASEYQSGVFRRAD
jgi:membrane protein